MAEIDPGTPTSSDILERFIKSGLHPDGNKKETWPKRTTVVCLIDNLDNSQDIVIKHNIPGDKHAEVVLVEYLKEELDPTKIKSITIYINYSPCTDCSVKLKKLKEDFPDLEIKMKFTSLYNMKRKSCSDHESKCCCREGGPEAFRMVRELGARPFQNEDWGYLINLLNKYFKEGLRYGDKYRVWRNGEDEKLLKDYETMSIGIPPSTPYEKTPRTEHRRPPKLKPETGTTGDGNVRQIRQRQLDSEYKKE